MKSENSGTQEIEFLRSLASGVNGGSRTSAPKCFKTEAVKNKTFFVETFMH